MDPQTVKHILWCDQHRGVIMPGQGFYQANGKIYCTTCWSKPHG